MEPTSPFYRQGSRPGIIAPKLGFYIMRNFVTFSAVSVFNFRN